MSEKPEGFHEHHRQKRRGGDERPVNKLWVSPLMHDFIEKNPQVATDLGWSVSQEVDPAEVVIIIPDEIIKVQTPQKRDRKPEAPRNRTNVTVNVPKDEREDGAGLLEDYVQIGRELLCEPMGWEDNVPAYNVIMVVMAKGLEAIRDELSVS